MKNLVKNINEKLFKGFSKTSSSIVSSLNKVFKKDIDESFYDSLEELLILSDFGVKTSTMLISTFKEIVKKKKIKDIVTLKEEFVNLIYNILPDNEFEFNKNPKGLNVYLFVGVNGVGKTTTIGKVAYLLKNIDKNKKILFAAGDTFRAGAIEQLEKWGERLAIDVIKQQRGSDSSAVIYDAINAAKSRGVDFLLCDTAGRLQSNVNLMEELSKIKRVISQEIEPEVFLVLDATTGQNAFLQAKKFQEDIGINGIILTKLDGTAKGGVIVPIIYELNITVYFIGVGESPEDLLSFNKSQFVNSIFKDFI